MECFWVFDFSRDHTTLKKWSKKHFFELENLWLKEFYVEILDYEIIEHSWTLECLEKTIFKQNNPVPSIIRTLYVYNRISDILE